MSKHVIYTQLQFQKEPGVGSLTRPCVVLLWPEPKPCNPINCSSCSTMSLFKVTRKEQFKLSWEFPLTLHFLKVLSQTSRHNLAQEGFRKIRYLTRPSRIDTRSTETSTSLMSALLQVCDTVWHRVTPRSYLNLSSSYTGQTKETLECVPVAVSTLLQVVELGGGVGVGGD